MAASVRKIVDERLLLSRAKGGGILRREIWIDQHGRIARYDLAYVNHLIFVGDNGRVVGYDSAHGYHHRHYKGKTTRVRWTSFDQIEMAFQREWMAITKEVRRAKD